MGNTKCANEIKPVAEMHNQYNNVLIHPKVNHTAFMRLRSSLSMAQVVEIKGRVPLAVECLSTQTIAFTP